MIFISAKYTKLEWTTNRPDKTICIFRISATLYLSVSWLFKNSAFYAHSNYKHVEMPLCVCFYDLQRILEEEACRQRSQWSVDLAWKVAWPPRAFVSFDKTSCMGLSFEVLRLGMRHEKNRATTRWMGRYYNFLIRLYWIYKNRRYYWKVFGIVCLGL